MYIEERNKNFNLCTFIRVVLKYLIYLQSSCNLKYLNVLFP